MNKLVLRILFFSILITAMALSNTGVIPVQAEDIQPPPMEIPPPIELPVLEPLPQLEPPPTPEFEPPEFEPPITDEPILTEPDRDAPTVAYFFDRSSTRRNYGSIMDAVNHFVAEDGYGYIYIVGGGPYLENPTINAHSHLLGIVDDGVSPLPQIQGNFSVQGQTEGFILYKLNIAGRVFIANTKGTINIADTQISGSSAYGLSISSHTGPIQITNTVIKNNASYGAYLNNTDSTSNQSINIINSDIITNTSYNIIALSDGDIIIADSNFGGSASSYGGYLDNQTGTGKISLTNATFCNNKVYGLAALSNGAINIAAIRARNNETSYGAHIDNENGVQQVTISGSLFELNGGFGLSVQSKGEIRIKNTSALQNGSYGAYLDNNNGTSTASVTITGSSAKKPAAFNNNATYGLGLLSNGNVELNYVTANNNTSGFGITVNNETGVGKVQVSNSQMIGNSNIGLGIETKGATTLNTINAQGNQIGTVISSTNNTIIKNSKFNGNNNGGLNVDTSGEVTLKNSQAKENTGGFGAFITNSDPASSAKVIVAGKSASKKANFSNNNAYGLAIQTHGLIDVKNVVSAYNTTSHGVYIANDNPATEVRVQSSQFNENGALGLYITCQSKITVKNITGKYNKGGSGIFLYNASANNPVFISGSKAEYNTGGGLYVTSNNTITVKSVSSRNNTDMGVYLINNDAGNTAGIIVQGKSSSKKSKFDANNNYGLIAMSNGDTVIKNISMTGNRFGGYLDTNSGAGMITLTNAVINQNRDYGLTIRSSAAVNLKSTTVKANGLTSDFSGIDVQTASQPVTLLKCKVTGNGKNGIYADIGASTLTLIKSKVIGNNLFGGADDPDIFLNVGGTLIVH